MLRKSLDPETLKRSRELRANMTGAERKLWYKLRELNAQGYHFRRQSPFRFYFLDFVEHGAKIVIELDGSQHGFEDHSARDRRRDETLKQEGYRVLRFFNLDVFQNIEGVVDRIVRECGAAPHPAPPEQVRGRRPPHKGEVKRPLPRKGLRAISHEGNRK